MTRKHILVVDDEKDLVDVLVYNLNRAGYDASAAYTGRQALELAAASRPVDLIVLDVMLPELSGTEVASRIRTNPATSHIPIVMLTAKTEEIDEIVGLTVGADDYVTKPFSSKILLARIDAILRRAAKTPAGAANLLKLGEIEINTDTHQVSVSGETIRLTLTEFRLLASLLQAEGKVLSRQILMSRAMGPGVTVTERTIDVHMTSIRKKLGNQAGVVRTVRGVGYRATTEPGEGDSAE
jgi:DNA-binding response OmpR family regulator